MGLSSLRLLDRSAGKAAAGLPHSTLDLGQAAVYEEFDAGDVAAVVGGEEDHGFGDFVGGADAAERDHAGHAGFELGYFFGSGEQGGDAGSVDGAGANDVDANFAVFEVDGPGASEGTDRGFGGAVDAEIGHTFDGD